MSRPANFTAPWRTFQTPQIVRPDLDRHPVQDLLTAQTDVHVVDLQDHRAGGCTACAADLGLSLRVEGTGAYRHDVGSSVRSISAWLSYRLRTRSTPPIGRATRWADH